MNPESTRLILSPPLQSCSQIEGAFYWGIADSCGNIAIVISERPRSKPLGWTFNGRLDWTFKLDQIMRFPVVARSVSVLSRRARLDARIVLNPIWKGIPPDLNLEAFAFASRGFAVAYHNQDTYDQVELEMIPSCALGVDAVSDVNELCIRDVTAQGSFLDMARDGKTWSQLKVDNVRSAFGSKLSAMERSIAASGGSASGGA